MAAIYKTTKEDFAVFKAEVAFWQSALGLLDWQIYTRHRRLTKSQGLTEVNLGARCATVILSTELRNYDDPPDELTIKQIAFHEVCEVFLARFMICAESRFVTRDELDEARHEIIRTLEKVIFTTGGGIRHEQGRH